MSPVWILLAPVPSLNSRPVSPEGVMECQDSVSNSAFVHSFPMQARGLPQEALLQLELKKLEMEEKRLQLTNLVKKPSTLLSFMT